MMYPPSEYQLGQRKQFIHEYCPKCNVDTLHRFVRGGVFELGAECTVCHTTWQMIEGCDVVGFNKSIVYKG